MDNQKIAQIDRGSMKRILGITDLFAVGYGDLGSSIYYALGITAFFALGATPLALLLAGIVFACTALTYAEMSSIMHESGGSASFSRKAFNDLISFIAGWGLLLDYIVTIAISSYAVAPYLAFFLPFLSATLYKLLFTVVLIGLLFCLNVFGAKHSTRLSLWLTGLTVLTQVVIIVIGVITIVRLPDLIRSFQIGKGISAYSPSWTQFIHGVAMAMVAYTGIESMAQLSGEAKNPSRTVPKAILYAMGTLLFMYLGVSIVALSAVTPAELSSTYLENPIAGIVSALPFGKDFLGPWVGFLAAIILLVAANAGLIGASRLSFNMGEYFQLPRMFYRLHHRYKTPYVSLLVFALFAAAIVIWSFGSLAFLADLYNFGAMLAFFSAHLSLIMYRIKYPDIKRPFRVSFNIPIGKNRYIPVTAIFGALASAAVWILVVITKPDGRYLGLVWIALGLVMYLLYRKKYQIAPAGKLEIEKVDVGEIHEVVIKKILVPTRGDLSTDTVLIAIKLAKLYGAELTVLHIIEVPFHVSMRTQLVEKERYSEAVLSRAQALGLELGVNMKLKVVRARSVVKSIVEKIKEEESDLVVLGAREGVSSLGPITEKIMTDAACRVWICRGGPEAARA